jgi:hypothetical protein
MRHDRLSQRVVLLHHPEEAPDSRAEPPLNGLLSL